MQLEVIGPPIGVDDQIGDEIGPCRLDENVDALGRAGSALRIANDPADGIARRDGAGADELLARLERDVGDLAGRGVDLIEGAVRERIDLNGVEITGPRRLDSGGAIRLVDAGVRIGELWWRFRRSRKPLEMAGQR